MSDISLNDITSGYNLSKINDNFTTIQNALNSDRIQVKGGGNTLNQELDMDGNKIINNPGAGADTETPNYKQLTDIRDYVEGLVANLPSGLGWFMQNGAGAIQRTFQDKDRERITSSDFDSSAGDDQAILYASQVNGDFDIVKPQSLTGVSLTSTVSINVDFSAPISTELASSSDPVLIFSGANSRININSYMDGTVGDATMQRSFIRLDTGSDGSHIQRAEFRNLASDGSSSTIAGLEVRSDNNEIDKVVIRNFSKLDSESNDSIPQGVAFQNGNNNYVGEVLAYTSRSVVVFGASQNNYVGLIDGHNVNDNGVYFTSDSTNNSVGILRYQGTDEAAVFEGSGNSIGEINIIGGHGSVRFQDATSVNIGSINIIGTALNGQLIATRTGSTETKGVKIGSISGTIQNLPFISAFSGNGKFSDVEINDVDIVVEYNGDVSTNKNLIVWDEGNSFHINNWRIVIRDVTPTPANQLTGSDIFYLNLPTVNDKSFLGNIRIVCEGAFTAHIANWNQENITVGGSLKVQSNVGPYLQADQNLPGPGLWASEIPTIGAWRAGTILFNDQTQSSTPRAWVCTADGTPGTWEEWS